VAPSTRKRAIDHNSLRRYDHCVWGVVVFFQKRAAVGFSSVGEMTDTVIEDDVIFAGPWAFTPPLGKEPGHPAP